jgi:hypothetical protein
MYIHVYVYIYREMYVCIYINIKRESVRVCERETQRKIFGTPGLVEKF